MNHFEKENSAGLDGISLSDLSHVEQNKNDAEESLGPEITRKNEESHVRFNLPDDENSSENLMFEKQAEIFCEVPDKNQENSNENIEISEEAEIIENKLTRANSKVDLETEGNFETFEENSESDQSEDEVKTFSRRLRRDSDKFLIRKTNESDENYSDQEKSVKKERVIKVGFNEEIRKEDDFSDSEELSARRVSFDRAANVTHIVDQEGLVSETSDPEVKHLASDFTEHILMTSVTFIRENSDLEIRRTELDLRASKTPDTSNRGTKLGTFETQMLQEREMSAKSTRSSEVTLTDDITINDSELETKRDIVDYITYFNNDVTNKDESSEVKLEKSEVTSESRGEKKDHCKSNEKLPKSPSEKQFGKNLASKLGDF